MIESGLRAFTFFSVRCGHVMLAGLVLLFFFGCEQRKKDPVGAAVSEMDRLYIQYLAGDITTARQSMLDGVKLAEKSELQESMKAYWFYLAYARLYLIEQWSERPEIASAHLVRARYWFLRYRELMANSPAQAASELKDLTTEEMTKFIEDWDQRHNDGRPPAYRSQPPASRPTD